MGQFSLHSGQGFDDNDFDIEIDWSSLGDVCELMPRRLLTTGILIQWMRLHFADPSNIENPFLKDATWSEDMAETQIAIEDVWKYDPAQSERRPGIYVKPGPWKVLQWGIDNRKMMRTGSEACQPHQYVAGFQGSHTLFCVAGESAEVEILAAEVYRELMEFGPHARPIFNFLRFVVTDIGEPSLLEEATENFVVPVVVSYGAQDVWIADKIAPELVGMNAFRAR